jgi:hypothetical protein
MRGASSEMTAASAIVESRVMRDNYGFERPCFKAETIRKKDREEHRSSSKILSVREIK